MATNTTGIQHVDGITSEDREHDLETSEQSSDGAPAEQIAINLPTEAGDSDDEDTEEEASAETDGLLRTSQGRRREHAPALGRSYSQDSVVSTQSAPPPYELYPPARTVFGRMYNWIRKIPRFTTHQAIYLPTLPLSRSRSRRTTTSSVSFTSIDSFASSAYPTTCCSYYYHYLTARCPTLPRFVLPAKVGRFRGVILCISFFALLLFSFLLFCSIFFAPAPLPDPVIADKTTDTYARFLTLNIFMRPPGVKNNWSDFKDDRLDYIIRYILPEYDVVAFQEAFAFASRRKDHLIRKAREMGFNHHVESPRHYPWEFAVDGGLLLLSRFPILDSGEIEYPRGTHSDWLARKGALHALVQLNATRAVHVYTTHAQASYTIGGDPSPQDVQIRLDQFLRLREWISQTSQADNWPVLLLGDFNVDAAIHGKDIPITSPSKESSREYKMMMQVLSGLNSDVFSMSDGWAEAFAHAEHLRSMPFVDVVFENYGYHPVTFGDIMVNQEGEIEPAEIVLTDQDEIMSVQSLDRILWASRETSIMQIENARVEKFLVQDNPQIGEPDPKNIPFTQVSDHYGVSCMLHLV
ncbi:hypothetical protein EC973_009531 [Apophysomyces ossiformis]|uniref:sphingomyelin phosphodiesterase n=1 Tax=Apophysomyces ossiformis TaxID=679940 RepID=A0A8H7BS93_9FUNG|nr:hypothetical protein EC973_009531 [Apophysomyces ossiformis]